MLVLFYCVYIIVVYYSVYLTFTEQARGIVQFTIYTFVFMIRNKVTDIYFKQNIL